MGTGETKIVREVLSLLRDHHILAFRNNTGVARIGGRWVRFGVPGSPDIIGVLPGGRFLGIEVKTATGKEADHQRDFRERIELSGGVAIVVHSIEEALAKIKEYIRPRGQQLGGEL